VRVRIGPGGRDVVVVDADVVVLDLVVLECRGGFGQ
jgi:hypothetical protein